MAGIPSCEAILLEIQQSFGTNSLQTLEKRRFANLEKKMSEHHAQAVQIIKEVVSSFHLGHDPALLDDLVGSAMQVLQFHGAVEAGTRTFGADDRQVAWHLLAYQIAPGLARKYGFWSLAAPVAPGMAGGDLWFLPRPAPSDAKCLRFPVQTVAEWWLDLLNCPHEAIWKDDKDRASRIRNLQNWQAGKLPTPATIGSNFDTNHKFRYLGTFQDRPGAPLNARFASALGQYLGVGAGPGDGGMDHARTRMFGKHPLYEGAQWGQRSLGGKGRSRQGQGRGADAHGEENNRAHTKNRTGRMGLDPTVFRT